MPMPTYPKIETVFERKADFAVDPTQLRRAEYGLINEWVLTEKVNGTNIRLVFTRSEADGGHDYGYDVRGKSDDAQIPPQLLNTMRSWCATSMREVANVMDEFDLVTYTLFGEGYGAKIDKGGGNYRPDQGFILFDVGAGGAWLDEQQVTDTAKRLGLTRVPTITGATIADAVALCQQGFASDVADVYDAAFHAEGVVAKTAVPLYDRRGQRLMWKLKSRDFKVGRR